MKIEFDGLISEKNQLVWERKRINETVILGFLLLVAVYVILIVMALLFYFFDDLELSFFLADKEITIELIIAIILLLLIYRIPDNILIRRGKIYHVIITEDEIMFEQICGKWKKKPITKVKKVVDYGEVYYIYYGIMVDSSWVCQKKNIVQGTIEEFESLFQSKIIRKNEESK